MNPDANLSQQLKDIKPLLEIPDNSFYLYWGLIILAVLIVLVLVYFTVKKLWKQRKINLAKGYLEKLKAIDWHDTKKSAYDATHYARLLATDERRKELFSQLEPLLEQYKYKKEVQKVDQDTLNRFNLYVQVADESI
jgi:membrane protein insertase Oxa1/YidC/SpoIIIJ